MYSKTKWYEEEKFCYSKNKCLYMYNVMYLVFSLLYTIKEKISIYTKGTHTRTNANIFHFTTINTTIIVYVRTVSHSHDQQGCS